MLGGSASLEAVGAAHHGGRARRAPAAAGRVPRRAGGAPRPNLRSEPRPRRNPKVAEDAQVWATCEADARPGSTRHHGSRRRRETVSLRSRRAHHARMRGRSLARRTRR
eukprot:1406398-Prymnesium_polylepis.1